MQFSYYCRFIFFINSSLSYMHYEFSPTIFLISFTLSRHLFIMQFLFFLKINKTKTKFFIMKFFRLLYYVGFMCLLIIDCSFYTLFGFLYSLFKIAAKCFACGKLSLSSVKLMYAPYVYFVYLLKTELKSSKKL